MIRSVTAAMVGLRFIGSLVPADPVALGQRDRCRSPPGARGIGSWSHALLRPGGADAVDPGPLRLDLVAPHEQSRIAFDQVEQQPFVRNTAPIFAERIGEADIE